MCMPGCWCPFLSTTYQQMQQHWLGADALGNLRHQHTTDEETFFQGDSDAASSQNSPAGHSRLLPLYWPKPGACRHSDTTVLPAVAVVRPYGHCWLQGKEQQQTAGAAGQCTLGRSSDSSSQTRALSCLVCLVLPQQPLASHGAAHTATRAGLCLACATVRALVLLCTAVRMHAFCIALDECQLKTSR